MSEKQKKFGFIEKIKNVKHIEIYIVLIFIIIVFLIYGTTFKNKSKASSLSNTQESELTVNSYISNLETSLEETLSQIKGVSNVKVLITLDLAGTTVKDNVIQASTFPNVKGILIVASGVQNTNVKLNVLKAVEAVIEINAGCIEILSSD